MVLVALLRLRGSNLLNLSLIHILKDLDSAGWKRLANTLGAYVARDKLPELDRATTKEQGQLTFPQEGQILEPGLYLVLGEETSQGNYTCLLYTSRCV